MLENMVESENEEKRDGRRKGVVVTGQYRRRSLLMLDDTPLNQKLLNPNMLKDTEEDPFSAKNAPYADPRIMQDGDRKDATNGLMYNNPESIMITEMTVCINEDNAGLAKALFMQIASKDVEVECRKLGT